MPGAFETTLAQPARDRRRPRTSTCRAGYELLVPCLRANAQLRAHFFGRLKLLFYAAAALRQQVADDIQRWPSTRRGRRIPLRHRPRRHRERAVRDLRRADSRLQRRTIGVPAPGVELKLAPVGDRLEARLRGPNITPGYWRRRRSSRLRRSTKKASTGWAMPSALVDPQRSVEGLRVRRPARGGLQALDRHLGQRRAAARSDSSRTSATSCRTS